MLSVNNPRKAGRDAVRKSVPEALWAQNERFSHELQAAIGGHRIVEHPIIAALDVATYSHDVMKMFHLEFDHAFAQVFTDALIGAMFKSSELMPRLGGLGKVSARFLFQLNVLDELGFEPNRQDSGDYAGNPYNAHYLQYEQTLRELGVSEEERAGFRPSDEARACRQTFEDCYDDYTLLVAIMAVAESVFTNFAGPWAKNVGRTTAVDVSQGYHNIHVEHDGSFLDDDHAEDSWFLFRQAAVPERYAEIHARTVEWLDRWADFLDRIMSGAAAGSAGAVKGASRATAS